MTLATSKTGSFLRSTDDSLAGPAVKDTPGALGAPADDNEERLARVYRAKAYEPKTPDVAEVVIVESPSVVVTDLWGANAPVTAAEDAAERKRLHTALGTAGAKPSLGVD